MPSQPPNAAAPPSVTGLTRRDLLAFAARGAAGVVVSQSLVGCGAGAAGTGAATTDAAAAGASPDAAPPACVLTAALTEGPFFVDERLLRSDIRADPSDGSVVAGVPLELRFVVSRVDNGACAPLTGAYLDVWHASPAGEYSDVSALGPPSLGRGRRGPPPGPPPGAMPRDTVAGRPGRDGNPGTGTVGRKFLRGYQLTDAAGSAQFRTVYPGWYRGRAVHIHFKLRLFAGERATYEFTSQLFFDEALSDAVFARAPYDTRGARDTRNAADGIYNELTPAERAALTLAARGGAGGYAGAIDLGVRVG